MKKQNNFFKTSKDLCPCKVNYKCREHCPRSNFKLYRDSITSENSDNPHNFFEENFYWNSKLPLDDSSIESAFDLKKLDKNDISFTCHGFKGLYENCYNNYKYRSSNYLCKMQNCSNTGLIDINSLLKWLNPMKYNYNTFKNMEYRAKIQLALKLVQNFFGFRLIRIYPIAKTSLNKNSQIMMIMKENHKFSIFKYTNDLKLKKIKKSRLPYFPEQSLELKTNIILSGKYEFIAYGIEKDYPESGTFIEFFFYNIIKRKLMKIDSIRNYIQLSNNEEFLIFCNKLNVVQIASTRKFIVFKKINFFINNPLFEILGNDKVYCCSRYLEKVLKVYNINDNSFTENITLKYGKTNRIKLNNFYFVAAFNNNKKILVYTVPDLKDFFSLKHYSMKIKKLEFLSDSSKLVSVGSNLMIIIWCLSTRNVFKKINLPLECIFLQVLNNKCILRINKNITIIKLEGEIIDNYTEHIDEVSSLTISKSFKYFGTGGHDKKIIVWNTKTRSCISKEMAHQGCIHSLKFSDDDEVLISNGYDYMIKVWNLQSMEILKNIEYFRNVRQYYDYNNYKDYGNKSYNKYREIFEERKICNNCIFSMRDLNDLVNKVYYSVETLFFIIEDFKKCLNLEINRVKRLNKSPYLHAERSFDDTNRKMYSKFENDWVIDGLFYFNLKNHSPVITNRNKYMILSDSSSICVLKL